MDQAPLPGIKPLPLGQPANEAQQQSAQQPAQSPPSIDERVDEWLVAHPEGKHFEEPNATTEQPPTPEVPPTEPPPTEPPQPQPETAQQPPLIETQPQAQPQPQAEQPKPPPTPQTAQLAEPIKFSLDAKYRFADNGPEWTGQQIVDGLRERSAYMAKAQEADVYRETFEMDATQAKELWAPNIAWLRNNPRQVEMIASVMGDPNKAQYILACSQYWDSPEGQQVRAQQQPQQQQLAMSPEVEKRFQAIEARNKQLEEAEANRRKVSATDRITRELNVAFERYPYLRDNPAMVQSLLARAYWLNNGDDSENSKGVLDALEMEKGLYDAQLAALNQATQIAREAVPPTPAVPPLMGSAGAAPQATASPRAAQPKSFSNTDDAVDEWMQNPPAQFR
jgi:hypothetical protein